MNCLVLYMLHTLKQHHINKTQLIAFIGGCMNGILLSHPNLRVLRYWFIKDLMKNTFRPINFYKLKKNNTKIIQTFFTHFIIKKI